MSGCSQKNYHKLIFEAERRQEGNTLEAVDRLPEGGGHVGSDKVGGHPCLVKSPFPQPTAFVLFPCATPTTADEAERRKEKIPVFVGQEK